MLHLHTSGRIEPLAEHLAQVLSAAPADPMAPEWIAVPSEGMRRWLHLELARHLGAGPGGGDGIAANIERASPASLRLDVLDAASGGEGADPWRLEHLVWSVLAELTLGSDGELATLADVPAGGSRYSRARRIADLFDRYHVHRTDMVLQWAEHHDVDGSGRPLAEHHRWQPQLWRRVRDRIGTPSPPERLPELLVALHSGELQLALPDRLAMFGLSVLPGGAGFLDLADAVGATRELHVFLLEPSPSAARHVATQVDRPGDAARLRAEDRSAELVSHPLLRSWGRLHRETTVLLADGEHQGVAAVLPLPDAGPAATDTLLGRLQADLHLDRAPSGELVVAASDRSVELHAAHGDARQVEVLRDVLLHLLADDDLALSEDDIVVMSPALDRLAPIIEAVLGPSADQGGTPGATPALRYRIADRSLRSATPLLDALDRLLAAVAGRFDAPTVLDLVALTPVRTRFGLSDDDVARIGEWAQQGRVRWGLDEQHRDRLGLPAEFDTNTWRAALDRLLLGVAVADDRHLGVGDVVAMALGGDDTSLVGRLAELVWRLEQLSAQVDRARPLQDWLSLVRHAVEHVLAVDRDDAWQMDALTRVLAELEEAANIEAATASVPLDFVDLRRVLGERLGATPGRADFFRGGITVSSMTPLRGVPHRVIVLLGVDQPAFTVGAPDGDDLAAATPLLGDRDRRGESRQALLEAVLAARERLVLIREGHDVRTNQAVPRSVPVAELVDTVLATVVPDQREQVAARLEVVHPRQPFDEAAFRRGVLAGDGPWSFDGDALQGALARRARDGERGELLTQRLAAPDQQVIELADLHEFLKEPLAHFVRHRLAVRLPRREEAPPPNVPLNLVGLDRYDVGNRLFGWLLDGGDVESWEVLERRLGTLGPGSLGVGSIDEVRTTAQALLSAADDLGVRRGPPRPVPVDVRLADGTRVVGLVEDRLDGQPGPARTTYSSVRPAYQLAAWLDLVVLVASEPTVAWRSVGVHKHGTKAEAVVVDLELTAASDDAEQRRQVALDALEVAVDCYRRGTVEPLPLFPLVSFDLANGASGTGNWVRHQGGGDGTSAATRLVYGERDLRDLRSVARQEHDPLTHSGPDADRPLCFAEYLWDAVATSARNRADVAEVAS